MLNIVSISERGDPRIASFVSVRERDLGRGEDGRFIVEGKVTLETLLRRSRFEVESLFLCETRLDPLADILQHVPEGVPIYTVPQALMDEIVGFPIHRGILACARIGRPLAFKDLTGASTLLVLNQISNHDNVGAAFRSAAAFGAGGVLLDEQSCSPLYRKAIRVSSGASLWLPFVQAGSGLEHLEWLKAAGYTIWAMTPQRDAKSLYEMQVPEKLAIVLGAEGSGLPAEMIDAAEPVRIPMETGFDSVNVATAGAIALSHVSRRR